jgi:hypothetical protein
MRMKLTEHGDDNVTIEYDDPEDAHNRIIERYVGEPGGYIFQILPNGSTRQPCDRSEGGGNTLSRGMSETLATRIRYEWSRKMRAERAERAYWRRRVDPFGGR